MKEPETWQRKKGNSRQGYSKLKDKKGMQGGLSQVCTPHPIPLAGHKMLTTWTPLGLRRGSSGYQGSLLGDILLRRHLRRGLLCDREKGTEPLSSRQLPA